MKLLMITRKVDKDDAQVGFAFNWINKLSQKVDQLKVICLEKGNIDNLSNNIEVFSLGKENGKNRIKEFINFQKGALKFIKQVDGVFCHQNPEYTILIAPYAKLFRKRIVCFYGHKAINWRVKLMHFFSNKVVTSSEGGFQINSSKRKIIGQGIDTDLFKPDINKKESKELKIIAVGRISPIKNYETLIKATKILKNKGLDLTVNIAGPVLLEKQKEYLNELKQLVKKEKLENQVHFLGGTIQLETVKLYQNSDLSVNLCPTGAPDKVGFEAMACAIPLLACNYSYVKNFGPYSEQLLFKEKNPKDLAEKILNLYQSNQLEEIGDFLRNQVVKYHNLDNLLKGIIECF
jgi:glycosyltransferase involved in cell wall biosynthesis